MFILLWRTIHVRVRSNDLLIFSPLPHGEITAGGIRGVLSRFRSSWREDYSLLSWADKGQWETVQTTDGHAQREENWFRIGFEPVFVDYTKRGSYFVLATLIEVCLDYCAGRSGGVCVLRLTC